MRVEPAVGIAGRSGHHPTVVVVVELLERGRQSDDVAAVGPERPDELSDRRRQLGGGLLAAVERADLMAR